MSNPFWYLQLHTPDAARARAFYRQMFGWAITEDPADAAAYAEIDAGEGPGGGVLQVPGGPAQWLPFVRVDDAAAAVEQARRLGAAVVLAPVSVAGKGTYAVIDDPTGASFAVWQPLAP